MLKATANSHLDTIAAGIFLAVAVVRPHLHAGAFPYFDGAVLLALLIAMALQLLQKPETPARLGRHRTVMAMMGMLVAWLALTVLWSPDRALGVRAVAGLATCAISFLLAYMMLVDPERRSQRLGTATAAMVLPVAAHAVYQKVWGTARLQRALEEMSAAGTYTQDISAYLRTGRVAAGFGNPNMLAGFLAVALPVMAGAAMAASGARRMVYWVVSAITLAVLILSGSFGGLLAAAGGLAVLSLPYLRGRLRRILLAALPVALAVAALLAIRGTAFLTGPESSLAQRWEYFRGGMAMALERPLLGWGAGGVTETLMRYLRPGTRPVTDPHNTFITLFIWGGVTAVVLALVFLVVWTRAAVAGSGAGTLPAGWPLVAGAASFWLHGMVDMDFSTTSVAFFGWAAMGGALAVAGSASPNDRPASGGRGGPMAAAVLMAACLPVFAFTYGEMTAGSGRRSLENGNYTAAIADLRLAGRILPYDGHVALDLARAMRMSGQPQLAAPPLSRAMRQLPESPYPPWEAGVSALQMRQPDLAMKNLQTALGRYPNSAGLRLDLARALLMSGRREQALLTLEEAIRHGRFEPLAVREARAAQKTLALPPEGDVPPR